MIKKLLIILLLVSCATKIKNFEKYTKAPLLELEEMPEKAQIDAHLPRVLIVAEEPNIENIAEINAHNLIKNNLTTLFESEKFASVVERIDNNEAVKEMKIAEFEGKPIETLKSVDYVININISNATFSSNYSADYAAIVGMMALTASQNNNSNNSYYTPSVPQAQYKYTASIDGLIKIYAIPSMKILKAIPIKATVKEKEAATVSSGAVIGAISLQSNQLIAVKDKDLNLSYKAIQKAMKNVVPEIKRFIQKSGYILEKRTLDDKAIFSINRGTNHGFKSQDKLSVMRTFTEPNPLTEEEEESDREICKGKVSDRISSNRAWVVLDESCQSEIKMGDKSLVLY
jgi:hypothetical protein